MIRILQDSHYCLYWEIKNKKIMSVASSKFESPQIFLIKKLLFPNWKHHIWRVSPKKFCNII